MIDFTNAEKLKCAERELAMRKGAYPRFVASHSMTQKKADYEIALMSAIADDYRRIVHGERLI